MNSNAIKPMEDYTQSSYDGPFLKLDDNLTKKCRDFQDEAKVLYENIQNINTEGFSESSKELTKRFNTIKKIVDSFDEHNKILNEISELESLSRKESDIELLNLEIEEINSLKSKVSKITETIKEYYYPKDPDADKDLLLEIRAATGGEEAALFALDLFKMYSKYALIKNLKFEVISSNSSMSGGLKEVIVSVKGKDVYKLLKHESGVHRVQRIPATETQGRVHTSAATVAVMLEPEEVDLKIEPEDLRIDVYKSSGHGGQSVNTTDSAVRITHLPTNLVVTCQDEKSQHKNKAKALRILRSRLLNIIEADKKTLEAKNRKNMVGSGDRSEKIRTYNFSQGRITDHRAGITLHKLSSVMDGNMDELLMPLSKYFESSK
jgi:peptide chain release factor 1